MSKNFSAVLILCMSAMSLAGCSLLRVAGPCYGVGCPAGTEGRNGQYKQGEGPKTQNASAPATTKSASAPTRSASATAKPAAAQSASASTSAQSVAAQSPATASTAPQTTTAQATSAQSVAAQSAPNANAEAKPSPFHAIGEFFERLIPHHSSSANSGAGN